MNGIYNEMVLILGQSPSEVLLYISYLSERPLCSNMKIMPLVTQWQNWSTEYAAGACLCLKSNELEKQIEVAVSVYFISKCRLYPLV